MSTIAAPVRARVDAVTVKEFFYLPTRTTCRCVSVFADDVLVRHEMVVLMAHLESPFCSVEFKPTSEGLGQMNEAFRKFVAPLL